MTVNAIRRSIGDTSADRADLLDPDISNWVSPKSGTMMLLVASATQEQ